MSDGSRPEPWSRIDGEEGAVTEVSDLLPPPTIPAGWYDDPERPGSLRYWDGTMWAESNTPGWKDVGDSFLWWDGQQYTARATWDRSTWKLHHWDGTISTTPLLSDPRREQLPPAPPRGRPPPRPPRAARLSMIGLVIAGCVAFMWWSVATEPEQCPGGTQVTYSESGAAWVSWFVLVGLAVAGLAVWWTLARRSTWIMVVAILGVVAAVGTSPLLVLIADTSDCSPSGPGSDFRSAVEAGGQTNHQEQLALAETPFIVRHVVPVDGYTYVDARELEIRDTLEIYGTIEAQFGEDLFGAVSLHGVVADDPSQNQTGRFDGGLEVGFLVLTELNEPLPWGLDNDLARSSFGGSPIATLEVAGLPVFVFEDPTSDRGRYTYVWFQHGVQGFIDGSEREPIERWLGGYLEIPKLNVDETEQLHARLSEVPGFRYVDIDQAEPSGVGGMLGPLEDVAHSAHFVANQDGWQGTLVLAEADSSPLLQVFSDLDVVDQIEVNGQQVTVLEGTSDGVEGSVFVFQDSGISGSLAHNARTAIAARRFLEAFLAN